MSRNTPPPPSHSPTLNVRDVVNYRFLVFDFQNIHFSFLNTIQFQESQNIKKEQAI